MFKVGISENCRMDTEFGRLTNLPICQFSFRKFATIMDDTRRKYQELVDQIQISRYLSIFINVFASVQLLIAVILPDILPELLKIWLLTVSCGAIVGILFGLLLSREDPKTTNFFIYISIFISGLVLGISIVTIIVKVKK